MEDLIICANDEDCLKLFVDEDDPKMITFVNESVVIDLNREQAQQIFDWLEEYLNDR